MFLLSKIMVKAFFWGNDGRNQYKMYGITIFLGLLKTDSKSRSVRFISSKLPKHFPFLAKFNFSCPDICAATNSSLLQNLGFGAVAKKARLEYQIAGGVYIYTYRLLYV